MRVLVDQLEQSLTSGAYFLSLFTALSLPDIAGALNSQNGEASGLKYARWYEKWVRPRCREIVLSTLPTEAQKHVPLDLNPLDGDACYRFRCSLLHQGTTSHSKSPFSRIMFIEPGGSSNIVHYGVMDDALCIDLAKFCEEVIAGIRLWLEEVEGEEPFFSNYKRFVRRHPKGLAPYIVGVPVVS